MTGRAPRESSLLIPLNRRRVCACCEIKRAEILRWDRIRAIEVLEWTPLATPGETRRTEIGAAMRKRVRDRLTDQRRNRFGAQSPPTKFW
jgi:hypothetical protein